MTKQEEIIDKLAKYLYQWDGAINGDWGKLEGHQQDNYRQPVMVDMLPILHSQGVVIKVGVELLITGFREIGEENPNGKWFQVEPLIKEE